MIYNYLGKDAGWTVKNKSFDEGMGITIKLCSMESVAKRTFVKGSCGEKAKVYA